MIDWGPPPRCAPADPWSSWRSAFTCWTKPMTSPGWASASGR